MKRYLLFLCTFVLLFPAAQAQVHKISSARKVKMGYRPLPQDMRTSKLDWTALDASCITDLTYGAWFDIKVRSNKMQFTVHTGGNMGNIEDPRIYLGQVVESRTGTRIQEVCCVAHEGDDGEFSIQRTDLDPDGTYYLLVASSDEKETFAISTTEDFEPLPAAPEPEVEKLNRIFGRILDAKGDARSNIKVNLLDGDQQAITSSLTDADGVFKFEKLQPDEVYLTRIDAKDTELEVEMFLIDDKGSIKSRATRIGDRLYGFGIDQGFRKYIRLLAQDDYQLDLTDGQQGVVGRVVDKQTFLFGRQGVEVGLYDKHRKLMQSSTTDDKGLFSFVVADDEEYNVQVKSDAQKDYTEIVIVDELSVPVKVANSNDAGADGFFSFRSLPQDVVELKRMEVEDTQMKLPSDFDDMSSGKSIVLKNILFAYGSADLLESSHEELDRLADQLKRMSSVRIEVGGHTDNQGSTSTNLILSRNRAKAVVDYLKKKGVAEDRLSYKGYGETQPIASNETEKGRRENRRVEFKVVD